MQIGFDAKRFFHNKTGLGNYSRDLVRILSEYFPEHQYHLYNPKPKKINRIPIDGFVLQEHLPQKKAHQKFPAYWRFKGCVNQILADNIQIFHGLSGEIPLGLSKSTIKTVVTIHDLIFLRYPELYSFFDRKIHYAKFKHAAQNADVVIAISNQTKEDIITYLDIAPEKIKVIYQGCAPEFKILYQADFKEEVRKKHQLPQQFILNVGTIEKRKNVLSVVQAIQVTDIPLVIIGKKTEYYEEVIAFIEMHQMQQQVLFLKNVALPELAAIYQMATVFVYPSFFEGFGIPIIEALYSKTPVITTKYGCFPEAGGVDSIYITPDDVNEIRTAIERLWNHPELRIEIAEKGNVYAQKFNDAAIANQMMEMYGDLKIEKFKD